MNQTNNKEKYMRNSLFIVLPIFFILTGCNGGDEESDSTTSGTISSVNISSDQLSEQGAYISSELTAQAVTTKDSSQMDIKYQWTTASGKFSGNSYEVKNSDWPGSIQVCAFTDSSKLCSDAIPLLAKHPVDSNLSQLDQIVKQSTNN